MGAAKRQGEDSEEAARRSGQHAYRSSSSESRGKINKDAHLIVVYFIHATHCLL